MQTLMVVLDIWPVRLAERNFWRERVYARMWQCIIIYTRAPAVHVELAENSVHRELHDHRSSWFPWTVWLTRLYAAAWDKREAIAW